MNRILKWNSRFSLLIFVSLQLFEQQRNDLIRRIRRVRAKGALQAGSFRAPESTRACYAKSKGFHLRGKFCVPQPQWPICFSYMHTCSDKQGISKPSTHAAMWLQAREFLRKSKTRAAGFAYLGSHLFQENGKAAIYDDSAFFIRR